MVSNIFYSPGIVSGGTENGPASGMPHTLGCPTTRPLTKRGCPKPLAIELFTLKPRRLGKHQNLHVECAQADFEKLLLWDLKFLWGFLKRNMSARPMVGPCLLSMSMTGHICFPTEGQKILVKVLKAQAQSQKAKFKMKFWVIKKSKA